MTGRVHRQPQKKPVLSIHLLGNETADVLVANMAEGKQDMMEAFLSKKAGQGEFVFNLCQFFYRLIWPSELYDLLSGGGGDINDEDDESISSASAKPRRQKTTASKATNLEAEGTPSAETHPSASAHSANPSKPKGKLRQSNISVSAPPSQSVSSNSKEKVPKTQTKEKKAKTKAEADARAEGRAAEKAAKAEERAAAKAARAEEKAMMKAERAALKGKGKAKSKGNPRFDSPEPSAPNLSASGVLPQAVGSVHDADDDGMDVDPFPQQTQDANPNEAGMDIKESSGASQGVATAPDQLPEGGPAAQSKDVDMDAGAPSGGVRRPTLSPSPSLSRTLSGDDSMRSIGAGTNSAYCI